MLVQGICLKFEVAKESGSVLSLELRFPFQAFRFMVIFSIPLFLAWNFKFCPRTILAAIVSLHISGYHIHSFSLVPLLHKVFSDVGRVGFHL